MICKRCGNEMPDNATICPICGTSTRQPATNYYGSFPPSQSYEQGYTPDYNPYYEAPSTANPPNYIPPPQQNYGYSSYQAHASYQPGPVNIIINNPPRGPVNEGALVAEIIFSLFGIFGIGWLMAGETTIGTILLISSFFLYWPLLILGTIFTLGLGLICLGPLAIAGIIINAILLNNVIKRKNAQYIFVQTPGQMPPRPQ